MIAAWYEAELVTRGTEIDPTATVGMPVVLRYFEHLRWNLMLEDTLGIKPLVDDGHFFVVRSQTVELRQRVGQGVRLAVRSRLDHAGRSSATVIHEAYAIDDGSLVARARVIGVWLGPDRKMARLPDGFRAATAEQRAQYPASTPEPPDERPRIVQRTGELARSFFAAPRVTFSPLSIAVDAPAAALAPPAPLYEHVISVPPRDLDVFSHVNAATWLTYADDARAFAADAGVLDPAIARGYTARTAIFYGREACCHDRLRVALAPIDGPFTERHALGFWFFRDPEPEPLCTLRVDLVPGAPTVTAP